MPTRVALIGAGGRGRSHIECLLRIGGQDYFRCGNHRSHPHRPYVDHAEQTPDWVEDVSDLDPELTAIADPSAEARDRSIELVRSMDGPLPAEYEDWRALQDAETVDAVIVASPNDTHLAPVTAFADDDVDVLCDKPLATTLADHDEMADAVSRSSGAFYPGFNLRSHPLYTRMQRIIDDERIGDVGMISASNVRKPFPTGFRSSRDRTGGALLEKNCHDFDLFNWYTDAEPRRVFAAGGQHVFTSDTDIVDQATVTVEFDDGVVASLELCLYAPFRQEETTTRQYEIRGSDGVLRQGETLSIYTYDDVETIEGPDIPGGHSGADLIQMKRFLSVIAGRAEPPADVEDARRAAALAIGAQQSLDEGQPVAVSSLDGS